MKKTLLFSVAMIAFIFVLASCGPLTSNPQDDDDSNIRAIYASYVAYAEERGEEPLDYEAWLDEIKGAEGAPGKDGKDGERGENGRDGKDGIDGLNPSIGKNGNW